MEDQFFPLRYHLVPCGAELPAGITAGYVDSWGSCRRGDVSTAGAAVDATADKMLPEELKRNL